MGDLFDFLWNLSQEHQLEELRGRLDQMRLERDLAGGDRKMKELAKAEIPPWRFHDIRRTVVTGMCELGIRPDVVELCVNHQSGSRGGVAGVYNKAQLLPERADAFTRWAQHLAGIVEQRPANLAILASEKARRA